MILDYRNTTWRNIIDWKSVTNELSKVIMIEAPGYSKENFDLKVEGNVLSVEARIEDIDEYRYFYRSYELNGYEGEDIEAEYDDGELRIQYTNHKGSLYMNLKNSLNQIMTISNGLLNNVKEGIKIEVQRILNKGTFRIKGKKRIKVN